MTVLAEQSVLVVAGAVTGTAAALVTLQINLFNPHIRAIEAALIDCQTTVSKLANRSPEGQILRVYFYVRKAFFMFRNVSITGLLLILVLRLMVYWGVDSAMPVGAIASVTVHIVIVSGLAFVALGKFHERYRDKFDLDPKPRASF